mmetsp:Transcript_3199/g.11582  ORF Transcript_3199/g.11582 Transcript_3199/m.11582 type:complete len:335 (-) Transcript_3199:1688-2692(-)|eukprot:scaffold2404_cov398-Prasinococcus_capsulatus_cf.AAC.21
MASCLARGADTVTGDRQQQQNPSLMMAAPASGECSGGKSTEGTQVSEEGVTADRKRQRKLKLRQQQRQWQIGRQRQKQRQQERNGGLEAGQKLVYCAGRYVKLDRNVPQTQWIINEERKGISSVQEEVESCVREAFGGGWDSCIFMCAGREDVDVRMLGDGRPFLLELRNPRIEEPSNEMLKKASDTHNAKEVCRVEVHGLEMRDKRAMDLLKEGEDSKQKTYICVVWLSRDIDEQVLKAVESIDSLPVEQRTPIRVLHRRTNCVRIKTIISAKIERVEGQSQYAILRVCTEAGTYVKEWVHGDRGRTRPSLGELLNCEADILQLDVEKVHMEW